MLTINEQANVKIMKAIKAMDEAVELLMNEPAYNNNKDVFHASTVRDVNRLITAVEIMNE